MAKGMVTSSTSAAGSCSFSHDISGVDVTGFTRVSAVNSYDDVDWTRTVANQRDGTARFTLKLRL